jgi:hypothetical protein
MPQAAVPGGDVAQTLCIHGVFDQPADSGFADHLGVANSLVRMHVICMFVCVLTRVKHTQQVIVVRWFCAQTLCR